MITVSVGREYRPFLVHKSVFFRDKNMLAGMLDKARTLKEGRGRVLLPGVDPLTFSMFLTWLYTGKFLHHPDPLCKKKIRCQKGYDYAVGVEPCICNCVEQT